MRVPRVELHRRLHMGSSLFVQIVRGRICMPRHYLINYTHRHWSAGKAAGA